MNYLGATWLSGGFIAPYFISMGSLGLAFSTFELDFRALYQSAFWLILSCEEGRAKRDKNGKT